MRKRATPEQIAKAKEKRGKVRELAKRIAAMSEDQRKELVRDWPTTIEGHAVSLKNACLVALMRPGATVIGGFQQWRKAGRPIKKGEHSTFFIWVPLNKKKKDEDSAGDITEDGERPNFALVPMFDVTQTRDANEPDTISEEEVQSETALERDAVGMEAISTDEETTLTPPTISEPTPELEPIRIVMDKACFGPAGIQPIAPTPTEPPTIEMQFELV